MLKTQPHSIEIEALWQDGKKAEAEHELSQWMKQEKHSPWPWVQAAIFHYEGKKYNKSLSDLKTALDNDPHCAEAYFWRGKNFEAQKKPMDAANEYRAALMVEEKFNDAQEALNRVLAQLGSS